MKCLFVDDAPCESSSFVVKVAGSKQERAWCRQALKNEHGLGAGHPVGRQLWQVVSRESDGERVAVVVWAASALCLKEREAWIGWDGMRRSQRLDLIVNNTRLLILAKSRQPNLATQALGTALRALPAQWAEAHGYRPLLAEAFTDVETHHGTSYKASNWIALGHTKGFERHRADFYVRHGRPKKLWVYPLHPQARERLCAAQLAPEQAGGERAPTVRTVLPVPQLRSLGEVFAQMHDPRRVNSRRYGLRLMLTLIALGLLCGGGTLSDIVRSVQLLSQRDRKALGLPRKKASAVYRVPCYNAFRELLPMLDIAQMLRLLSAWLTQHEGTLPRTLALDGKDLGAQLGTIISLINTTESGGGLKPGLEHDGTPAPPVAMAVADGKGHEQSAALQLLASAEVNLQGAIVTADALHCHNATLHEIVAGKGGDYIISLKDNQPKAAAYARGVLASAPPLFRFTTKPTAG
jgi:hypothetical protein